MNTAYSHKPEDRRVLTNRLKWLFFLICLAIVWLSIAWNHARFGKGLMRLHLELISNVALDPNAIQINAISAAGSTEPMIATSDKPNIWSIKRFSGNIKAIQVQGIDPPSVDNIKLVAGWEDSASPRLVIAPLSVTPIKSLANNIRGFTLTRSTPASLLPRFQDSLNWQGDFWFIAVTFSQSFVFVLCIAFVVRLLAGIFLPPPTKSTSISELRLGDWPRYFSLILVYGLIALILVQISDRLSRELFEFRDPLQQIVLCIVQTSLILCCLACLKFCRENRSGIYTWAIALVLLFSLKAIWLSQVTSLQCNDYGIYWSYGKAMANGDWNSLDPESPLSLALLRRSWAWCHWIAKLIGSTDTSLKLANFSLQLATAVLFSLYVKNRFGTAAMAPSLLAFVIYPESWFSTSLASHDLPALFWFIVLILAVDWLQQGLTNPISTYKQGFSLVLRSTAVGAAVAILDFQRDFGIFALFSLGLMSVTWVSLPNLRNVPLFRRMTLAAAATIITLFAFSFCGKILDYPIRSHYRDLPTPSALSFITSVESRGRPSWDQMQPWRFLYFPAIPENERLAFAISKLKHEKLVRLNDYQKQVQANTKQLGFSGGLIGFVFGGRAESFMPDGPIPWSSFLFATSAWIETCLGLLFLLRFLITWRTGLYTAEIFPLLFCITQSVAIILLGEVNASYDSFLVVPFSLAVGILISAASRKDTNAFPLASSFQTIKANVISTFTSNLSCIALPVLAIAAFTHLNLSIPPVFIPPESVVINKTSIIYDNSIEFDEDGVYITTPPPPPTELTTERLQVALWLKWTIDCEKDLPVHFFLAGNQRKLRITDTAFPHNEDPTEIELVINGKVHYTGRLSDLARPIWQTFTPSSSPAIFELKILSTDRTNAVASPSGVSVEYFWQPRTRL